MDTAHRKFKKSIRFTDASGDALANREVRISQVNHAFLFGCGAFDFMPFVLGKTGEYREITDSWLEIFNYGTLPFYWGRFEPEEGKPDTDTLMRTAQYLQSRGVKVKGHPLCWHTVCADWLMKYDNRTIMEN